MKIVLNKCYGGFGLSKKAYEHIGLEWDDYGYEFSGNSITGNIIEKRTNPDLIKAIEELGEDASGRHAKLVVVEVPDRDDYYITEYDGIETLHYGGVVV